MKEQVHFSGLRKKNYVSISIWSQDIKVLKLSLCWIQLDYIVLGSNFALLVKSPGDDGQQLLTTGSSYVYRWLDDKTVWGE